MTPTELLYKVRQNGVELELSDDGRRFRAMGDLENVPGELASALRRERLWILMLLIHEAGGDAYDPRLAFVASAECGLTRGGVQTRMEVAFGISAELAAALIDIAIEANYLVTDRTGLYRAVGKTAFELANQPAMMVM